MSLPVSSTKPLPLSPWKVKHVGKKMCINNFAKIQRWWASIFLSIVSTFAHTLFDHFLFGEKYSYTRVVCKKINGFNLIICAS